MTGHGFEISVSGLLSEAKKLKVIVANGAYNDSELQILSKILTDIDLKLPGSFDAISETSGVSVSVLRSISKGNHPKLHNFLGAVSGAIVVCEREIVSPIASITPLLPFEGEPIRDTSWIAEYRPNDRAKISKEIAELSEALQKLVYYAQTENDAARIMSATERAMLIALLESVLAQLKSPLVEIGLLKRLSSNLGRFSQRAVSKFADDKAAALFDLLETLLTKFIGGS